MEALLERALDEVNTRRLIVHHVVNCTLCSFGSKPNCSHLLLELNHAGAEAKVVQATLHKLLMD